MTVSVVTGGAGALGRAVVAVLAARGDEVVVVDRDAAALASVPDVAAREAADLGDAAAVDALFARIASDVGTPRAVVHTVGMYRGGSVTESEPDDFRLLMDVNIAPAWWVSRAAGRLMRDGGGAVVHVGARQGVEAVPGAAAYSLTKAAVVHLTRVLDAELRSDGVRVNAILPGLIDTPANRASMPADVMARAVAPEAIARVVAWLTSEDAAPVVGAVLPVYGTAR
jgi:NAD(P)-dependent dehydrogenase (short-subunit alcohol dehydrogenase family)